MKGSNHAVPVVLMFVSVAFAQDHDVCPLSSGKNGDMVRVSGEAIHSAHDGMLRLRGCKDDIVFEYADDPDLHETRLTLKKDESLQAFKEHFGAQQVAEPNTTCKQCWRYRVTAEFEGRLDITESAGWKKDAKGKLAGTIGFGHPIPFTRYRLVVTSISHVEATESVRTP